MQHMLCGVEILRYWLGRADVGGSGSCVYYKAEQEFFWREFEGGYYSPVENLDRFIKVIRPGPR